MVSTDPEESSAGRAGWSPKRLGRDVLDERLIELLRADGRRSYSDLGRELHHPTSTVKRRVEALIARQEILGFTVLLPETVMSEGTEAVVEVFCRGNIAATTLADHFAQISDVALSLAVAGAADAIVLVRAHDNEALGHVIEQIRLAPFIDRTRTSIVLNRL